MGGRCFLLLPFPLTQQGKIPELVLGGHHVGEHLQTRELFYKVNAGPKAADLNPEGFPRPGTLWVGLVRGPSAQVGLRPRWGQGVPS